MKYFLVIFALMFSLNAVAGQRISRDNGNGTRTVIDLETNEVWIVIVLPDGTQIENEVDGQ